MTVISLPHYESLPENGRVYLSDGSTKVENYVDVLTRRRTSQFNERSQRPKPTDLIANLTSSPLQYREDIQYGRSQVYSLDWGDSKGFQTEEHPMGFKQDRGEHRGPAAPFWDWPLDLRLRIERDEVNLGATLVEYQEAASMFEGWCEFLYNPKRRKSVARAWTTPGRRPVRLKTSKWYTTASGNWSENIAKANLGYSFGIAPLTSDLATACAVLANRLTLPVYNRNVVKNTWRDSGEFTADYENVVSGVPRPKYRCEWEKEQREVAGVYYTRKPDTSPIVFGNPLELAWERIPYSFVLDWGFNVGEVLASLDALRNIDIAGVYHTVRYSYQHKSVPDPKGHPSLGKHFQDELVRYYSHQRSVHSTIPLPQLPRWKPSFSYRKVLHGLSLLRVLRSNPIKI